MRNYTPLNLKKVKKADSSGKANTVLIVIAILTACVLAFILILLIKQRMNISPTQQTGQSQEEAIPSPPPQNLEQEASPSPELEQLTSTPTGSLGLTPTTVLSPSVSPSQ